MAIRGNLPKHLEVAARTGVLAGRVRDDMPYRRVATEIDLTASSTTFVDLGGMPIPTEDPKAVDTMVERGKTVDPTDFYLTLSLSQNSIDDDQTGSLLTRFRNVIPAFQRHINSRTFTVLNAGDTATYGTGISTATTFFNNSHLYPDAKNTTAQDNLGALALTATNFDTVWVAMRQFKDDQENYYELNPSLIVCHPSLNSVAANITGNPEKSGTANRDINPYTGVNYFTVPQFDTTAWVLIDETQSIKPLYVAIRKRPQLNNEPWFDNKQPDGGRWYWQYHGRYVVGYGDPLSAYLGNT